MAESRKLITRVRADRYDEIQTVVAGQPQPASTLTEFTLVGTHQDGSVIDKGVQSFSASIGLLAPERVRDFAGSDYVEVTLRKLSDDEVKALRDEKKQ